MKTNKNQWNTADILRGIKAVGPWKAHLQEGLGQNKSTALYRIQSFRPKQMQGKYNNCMDVWNIYCF